LLSTKTADEIALSFHQKKYKGKDVVNFRGSRFRGISKNGSSWQILLMLNKKKMYLGALEDEECASRLYDRVAIQY
jgi:hypothetical protein